MSREDRGWEKADPAPLEPGRRFNASSSHRRALGPVQDGRHRDVFPLPSFAERPAVANLSVSQRRRIAKHRGVEKVANDAIAALNELMPRAHQEGAVNAAQREAMDRIKATVADCPSFSVENRAAACELLVGVHPYDGGLASSTVQPYDALRASLPSVGADVRPVREIIDPFGRDVLDKFRSEMVLGEKDFGKLIESEPSIKPYMDVKLRRDRCAYVRFLRDLWGRNMLGATVDPIDLVTPFFVSKKGNKQRLVWDSRVANRRFKSPPPLAMASGAAWTAVEKPPGASTLYVAQSDVKDFFYCLGLEGELARFFCLPPITYGDVSDLGGLERYLPTMGASSPVWFHLKVVPMGWSWAFWLAQRVHQELVLRTSGLGVDRLLLDHHPAPRLENGQPAILVYCDNLNVYGTSPKEVNEVLDRVVSGLTRENLIVHEIEEASSSVTSLGYEIDGSRWRVRPKKEKFEKLVGALRFLAGRPRVSGKLIEKVIGHTIHVLLLRRELLSIPRASYDFIRQCYTTRVRLWKSVAWECHTLARLLPLCVCELARPWADRISISDASLSGWAAGSLRVGQKHVGEIGRAPERNRYRCRNFVAPRVSAGVVPIFEHEAARLDPFSDLSSVLPHRGG